MVISLPGPADILTFTQIVIVGLAVGTVYGLIALGFVVLFKATDIFNFAQGSIIMVGAYLAVGGATTLNAPLLVTVVAVLIVAFVTGAATHLVFIRPLMGESLLPIVMVTIGLSGIMVGVLRVVFGDAIYNLPSPVANQNLTFGPFYVPLALVLVAVTSLVCMGLFGMFFQRTRMGLFMRATAESHEAATVSGVDVNRVFLLAWGFSAVLGAAGGILLALINVVGPGLQAIGLLAFPAAVIGGLRSIPGAIVGGLLVGVLQLLGSTYVSTEGGEVVVYVALLAILLVRPYGFFGSRESVRA